jgi:FkbM family methyltransferase
MVSYSQNGEDLFVKDYFGDYKGTLLDIGANDGITFSNSRLLIENGWKAILVEPGYVASDKLAHLYRNSENVIVCGFGIGEKEERVDFWESGNHVPNGKDIGLVSTTNFEETKKWPGVEFTKHTIGLVPFEFIEVSKPFDFISIDAEGYDWKILQQINLEAVGCKVLCIEYNGDRDLLKLFTDYCKGFKIGLINAENIIFIK